MDEANDLIIFCISITDIGSIPAKGSSNNKNFGSVAKALAISTLLRSPPERLAPIVLRIFFIFWGEFEFFKNKKIVNDIYGEVLLRPADQTGIMYWGMLLENGLIDKEELQRQIYDSQEVIEKRLVSDPDLAIKIKFETLVNKAYFVVFEKYGSYFLLCNELATIH